KVAPPFKVAEFDVLAHGGISRAAGIFDVAVDLDVISKSGAFYRYGETMLGQGKVAAVAYLSENPKVLKEIEEKLWKEVKSGKAVEEKIIGQETEE
ncbi:DNA recombination/repair protein RecA, partial [Patescibacteria group bacterium]|nr:DNA recombination/repair protein RecA [Patescibacteria group bacterium]